MAEQDETLRLLLLDAKELGVKAKVVGDMVSIVLPLRNTEFNASDAGWWVVHKLGKGREIVIANACGVGLTITFTAPDGSIQYHFSNTSPALHYHSLLISIDIPLNGGTEVGRYVVLPGSDS